MGRNYGLPAIKTLFGEASGCAYPCCREPLIFRDRGTATVVAQIAHIRSERPGGPRHDADYPPNMLDEPSNLLLLCGKHHPPVDRHESMYSIEELEAWKHTQQVNAGSGTAVTDQDIRFLTRLTQDERMAMTEVARLAERVLVLSEEVQGDVDKVKAERQEYLYQLRARIGPVYEVDDAGNRKRIDDRIEMPYVDEVQWAERIRSELDAGRPRLLDALRLLREEIAVLSMLSGLGVASQASAVVLAADGAVGAVGKEPPTETRVAELRAAVAQLWAVANGDSGEPRVSSD